MSAGGLDWREKLVPIQTEKALSKRISRRMASHRPCCLQAFSPHRLLGTAARAISPPSYSDTQAMFPA